MLVQRTGKRWPVASSSWMACRRLLEAMTASSEARRAVPSAGVDETSGAQLWSRLEAIHRDPAKAKAKLKSIMATVEARQKRMVEAVRQTAMRT